MKKTIILIFLSALVKAQIVQPKSTTTFSNVNAVGSMTVVGNLRVTGSETITGNAVISKLRVGSTTAPSATLDVTGTFSASGTSTLTGAAKQTNTLNYEGNTTWNTNQTNTLTTGNTGTVAVLSDVAFPLDSYMNNVNLVDGTTYYNTFIQANSATQGYFKMYVPYNCTLIGWNGLFAVNGTLGSTESTTLNVITNGVTSSTTNIINTQNCANAITTYTNWSQSVNISAGSYVELQTICPTYATNPSSVYIAFKFWFVRRQ